MSSTIGVQNIAHTNGTNAMTVSSGGVVTQTNNPIFKAIGADSTAIANDTWVKAQFNNEVFDVGSYYDSSSNYRYTPQIAGKYLIYSRALITFGSDALNGVRIAIYKNGSQDATFNRYSSGSTTLYGSVQVQALIDFNGSSDYVEIYVRGFTSADISYNINNIHGEFSGYRIGG